MEPLSTEELMRRATALLALGNTPARVRSALQNMGASPEQVEEVMESVESRTQTKQNSDARSLWLLSGAVGLIMMVLFAGAAMFLQTPATVAATGQAPTPTPQPVQAILTSIPVNILPQQLPTEIPANFMAATPVVIRGIVNQLGGNDRCPTNDLAAARLFGGDPGDWTYEASSQGWTMTRVAAGTTITVPQGFVGGYMTIVDSVQMVRVDGPVSIENVNFIAISCP